MDAARRINRERVVVLGWGRAILLQFAHPLIATAIADHSGFDEGRLSRLRRLRATVRAMLDFTFGDAARAAGAADRINAIHARINGTLREPGGGYHPGSAYSATDPELLLWVHATLVDSVLLAFGCLVRPLTSDEKDEYCAAAAPSAARLGVPHARLPVSAAALTAYLDGMWASGRIEVTGTARSLARGLLFPPLLDPTRPGAWLNRLASLGLLPPTLRAEYDFRWTARDERSWRLTAGVIRRFLPIVPGVVRYWPDAR